MQGSQGLGWLSQHRWLSVQEWWYQKESQGLANQRLEIDVDEQLK